MPTEEELPPTIRKLARRNAFELTDSRWDYEVEQLINTLEGAVAPPAGTTPEPAAADLGSEPEACGPLPQSGATVPLAVPPQWTARLPGADGARSAGGSGSAPPPTRHDERRTEEVDEPRGRPFRKAVPTVALGVALLLAAVAGMVSLARSGADDGGSSSPETTLVMPDTTLGTPDTTLVPPGPMEPGASPTAPTVTVAPRRGTTSPPRRPEPTRTVPTAPPLVPGAPPPATSPTTAPAGFRIVDSLLRADPFAYTGACPVTIRFSGRISVAGGRGQVSYRFLRSDGASAPVHTLQFDGPGSQNVETTWTRGSGDGWQQLEILDPQPVTSERATFTIACS